MLQCQAIVIIFFICLGVPLSLANYGVGCITPAGENGKCVPLRSCVGAFEVFENAFKYGKENFKDEISLLQDLSCGSFSEMPIICCANEKVQINPLVYNHLKNQTCGNTLSSKISKGDEAGLFQFRWMVLLKYEGKEPFACGGSLIDNRHVLTAAHCLHNFTNLPIAVRLGEYDLGKEMDCPKHGKHRKCLDPVQDIGIKEFIIHEDYVHKDKHRAHHDIAILRLERPVNLNTRSIQPICLPISEQLQSNIPEEYQVAGWGMTEFGERSNILLQTYIPNRPYEYCNEKLGLTLSEENICAGGRQFQGSCIGDSGGPIFSSTIYVDGVYRAVQYGLVSVGALKCGETNVPSVYMSIPYYMQWITDHMIVEDDDDNIISFESKSSALQSENSVSCLEVKTIILFSLLLAVFLRAIEFSRRS